MTRTLPLTLLEGDILRVFHEEYGKYGFPKPDTINVVSRVNTGAGRRVSLYSESFVNLEDGYYDMGGKYICIEEVSHGLMAVVSVTGHNIDVLEIATYGNVSWSGAEANWKIE